MRSFFYMFQQTCPSLFKIFSLIIAQIKRTFFATIFFKILKKIFLSSLLFYFQSVIEKTV